MWISCRFNDERSFRFTGIGESSVASQPFDDDHQTPSNDEIDDDDDENDVITPENGVPDYAHSMSIFCMDRGVSFNDYFAALKTLLDNTPRKLANIRMSSIYQIPLSPEYLSFFGSMCNKAERLRYSFNGLSHEAELDCLATCLGQKDGGGIKELNLSLEKIDCSSSSSLQHLHHFFQSLATSPCLKKIKFWDIENVLGDELINALQETTKPISWKAMDLYVHWGRDNSTRLLERAVCAVVDHTQLEDLRLFASEPTVTVNAESDIFQEARSRFFEKLARAKSLKNLELDRGLLPRKDDDSYLKSLEDAISKNTCVERLCVRHVDNRDKGDPEGKWHRRYNEKLCVPLSVNRAARRLDHSAPLGLWPHVLERASKIRYYSVKSHRIDIRVLGDDWRSPSSACPRNDVVYKLLRERVLLR